MKGLILVTGIILLSAVLIQSTPPPRQQCQSGENAAKESAKAVSNLAVQLYKKVMEKKQDHNAVFSPVSIALALALVGSGAAGDTKSEIQRLLAAPASNRADSSDLYQALQSQLKNIQSDSAKLRIANGLFYAPTFNMKREYLNKVKECFETEITSAPFPSNPEEARIQINRWVSNITAAKIPELFKPNSIETRTLAVLANAIYFKAEWDDKFFQFENSPFYESGKTNKAKTVSFMKKRDEYLYKSTSNFDAVKIPYAEIPYSMHIVLPKQRDGIKSIEQSLTGDQLTTLFDGAQEEAVNLKLPKFTIRQSLNLKELLQALGAEKMFADQADFSRMADQGAKVSDAIHEAYIKVNENGTEAAAATAFKIVPMSARIPQGPPKEFIADHPFIFAIVHDPTKAILFLGKVDSVQN